LKAVFLTTVAIKGFFSRFAENLFLPEFTVPLGVCSAGEFFKDN
jgi:hypothetical protein